MMKILLINPPPYEQGENSRFLEKKPAMTYTMPLGIGYIASVLEKEGYDVSILDAYVKNLSYEEIDRQIRELTPEIIGIQCLSDQRASWFKLINLIRAIDKNLKIVLGGPHPTLMPGQVLTNFQPDAVVIGEGEETMLALVKTWDNKGNLNGVKGIAYLKDGEVVVTPSRERIKNLESLPFPSYHKVNLDDYSGWDFMGMLYDMLGIKKPLKYASISTSRGCVGDCGYCSAPLIWKRRWTFRSPSNVVDEMEMLNRDYDIEFIIMTDDIFSVKQKRVISICEEILRRNLKILWGFETSVQFISWEMLAIAAKAGCSCILYGVESGSEAVLSNISKRYKRDDVINVFELTKKAGIVSGAFLMVGNPGENEITINDTIKLLRVIKPDIVLPQITMITPGTKIFNIAKDKGFIDEGFWLTDRPFPYYTCEQNLETLLKWYEMVLYYQQ